MSQQPTGATHRRIVIEARGAAVSRTLVAAVAGLADAIGARIEQRLDDDGTLAALAALDCCREVRRLSGIATALAPHEIEGTVHHTLRGVDRHLARRHGAAPHGPSSHRYAAVDTPSGQADPGGTGLHNILALAETVQRSSLERIRSALARTTEAPDALLIAGPDASTRGESIVMALEDERDLPALLPLLLKISATERRRALILVIGNDREAIARLAGSLAEQLASMASPPRLVLAPPAFGEPTVVATATRKLAASLLIGRAAGLMSHEDGDLTRLLTALDCPVLLLV
ncbi:MAG: hypothetical protein GC150_00345 [Rhizobiales bacterium]|nr:hypothetical protein [Hyphomicrobiales bacterium]